MTPDLHATLDRLAERAANLLAASSDLGLGMTWITTAEAVEASRGVLAAARCSRPIDPADGGPTLAGRTCALPLPCPTHDARPAPYTGTVVCGRPRGHVGPHSGGHPPADGPPCDRRPACPHDRPLAGDCDECERDVRGDPAAVERAKAERAIADARLRVVVAAEACEVAAVRIERDYWMRRMQATLDREEQRRAALVGLVVRYRGNAGEPKPGSPEAADFDTARAWSEECVVCEETNPDAPRVAGRERHVYCGDACAESADCRACLGDGFEGPRENGIPCGECRPGDRLHYEAQADDDARDAAEQAAVATARDAELEGGA